MAIGPETQAVLTRFDAAANAIRDRIAQITADMDLTADEKAAFDAVLANLTELGTTPTPTPLPELRRR